MSISQIEIKLTFEVDGPVDQTLIDHLAATMEQHVHQARDEGELTPNDDAHEDTMLSLLDNQAQHITYARQLCNVHIQDWRVQDKVELPAEHTDTYRFEVNQSVYTNQVYFRLVPTRFDCLNQDLPQHGLSGVIEVRNGAPGISLGLFDEDNYLHIESVMDKGLFVHHDRHFRPEPYVYFSDSHNMGFDGLLYDGQCQEWLMDARRDLANHAFEQYDFGADAQVIDDDGWEIADTDWQKTVYFEAPDGGDSIKALFRLTFYPESTLIKSAEHTVNQTQTCLN